MWTEEVLVTRIAVFLTITRQCSARTFSPSRGKIYFLRSFGLLLKLICLAGLQHNAVVLFAVI